MKLTYFVSPYDLIDEENRTYDNLNPDTIIKRKIGYSVTVCMEGSTGHKLPTSSIITVNRSPTGKRYVRRNFISLKLYFVSFFIYIIIYLKNCVYHFYYLFLYYFFYFCMIFFHLVAIKFVLLTSSIFFLAHLHTRN